MNLKPASMAALQLFLQHVKTVLTVLAFAVVVTVAAVKVHGLQKQVITWQNQAALASKTVEDQKGLFERQAQNLKSVQSALDSKDPQIRELEDELKKKGEALDNATTVNISLRKALAGAATATQSKQQPAPGVSPSAADRLRVDFHKDFGWLVADGYTLTSPAEAFVSISQGHPLKLTVALSQDKQGAMHAYVTSSEADLAADVLVSAFNPSIRDTKWYERIGFGGSLGVGDGLLAGVNVTLDIDRFTVGPAAWIGINSQVSKFYGATLIWRPFAR
jgi:hypothetical protein